MRQIAHIQGSQLIHLRKQQHDTAVLGEIQGGQSIAAAIQIYKLGAAGYVQRGQLIVLAEQNPKLDATGDVQRGQLVCITIQRNQAGCIGNIQLYEIVVGALQPLKGNAIGQVQFAAQIRVVENDYGGAQLPVDILPCNGAPIGLFLVIDAPGGHIVRRVVLIELETVLHALLIGLLQERPELQVIVDVVALGYLYLSAAFVKFGVIVPGVGGGNLGNVNGGICCNQGGAISVCIPALEHAALHRGGHYGVRGGTVFFPLHGIADIAFPNGGEALGMAFAIGAEI